MPKEALIGILGAIILFVWSTSAHASVIFVEPIDNCQQVYNDTIYVENQRLESCVNLYGTGLQGRSCQDMVVQQTNEQLAQDANCNQYYYQNNLIIVVHGPVIWHDHRHHEWHREHHRHEHREHR